MVTHSVCSRQRVPHCRAGPPTFDVAVEMLDRGKWRVHLDVAQAVDLVLAGGTPGGQVSVAWDEGQSTALR